MFTKFARGLMFFLVTAGLLTSLAFRNNIWASAAHIIGPGGTNTLALVTNAPLHTGPLYDQPTDPAGKLLISAWLDPDGSDQDQYVWDNFTLATSQTITEIDWVGGYDPLRLGNGGPVVDFQVSIYPSIAAGTEPAVANPPLVSYMTGGNAGETALGAVGTIPMYSYTFVLPAAFAANGGEKYWVQIQAYQHGTLPDWGIAKGTGGEGSHYVKGAGVGGDIRYYSAPGDAAFTILGLIPDVPTDIFLWNSAVDENQPAGTLVGTLDALDPDQGATFTFSLACTVAGADDASFAISGTELLTAASFDYEAKNAFEICVRVENGVGGTLEQGFIISVLNVNEAPTDISLTNSAVNENQPINTLVGALSAADPDAGDTFAFGLSCAAAGTDDTSFNISGTNLQTSAVFDFETKSSYAICVRVTDAGGLTFEKNFTVSVGNFIEGATDILLSANMVAENQPANTPVGTLSAISPDAGATFTFSLACATAGADDASFNISGTNLQTSAAFDFEAKPSYSICVRATEPGGLMFDKSFTVTVNNVNEAPTDISLSNNTVDENLPANTIVGALSAVDPDAGDTFTFGLACAAAGADDTSFNISGPNLQTSAAFDFETKSTYAICVRVTDAGGLSLDKSFTVQVNDVAETTNTPGLAAGQGSVGKGQEKANIRLDVQFTAADADPTGDLTFMDHSAKLKLRATSFTLLQITGNHAVITGFATVDNNPNVAFTIDVVDNGGADDVFTVQIPSLNGYTFQGTLAKGDLTVSLR